MKSKNSTKRTPKTSSVSKSSSIVELGESWDTHDLTDFNTRPVKFTVNVRARKHYVAVDADLINRVRRVAAARGLSTQSLVNLWLQEKVGAEKA